MSAERVQYRNLTLLKFAPSLLSLYAESAGSGRAVPHDAEEALGRSGGEAVLDGPMFRKCDPSASYAAQNCGVVSYKHFDLGAGVDYGTSCSTCGMTVSVMPDGSTTVAAGSVSAPGARVAVQLYPQLVVRGDPVAVFSRSEVYDYVAALAVMRDGRLAFVVGRSLSLAAFSSQLAGAGAVYAGYTDGGGSTSLATLSGYVGSSEHRRVLTWLVARPSGSPSAGGSVLAIAALAALVAGAGWLWYRRGPRRNPIDTRMWHRGLELASKVRLFGRVEDA